MGSQDCQGFVPKTRGRNIVVPNFDDFRDDKWCSNCRRWLSISKDFHMNRTRHDGVCHYCKECDNIMRADRRRRNK